MNLSRLLAARAEAGNPVRAGLIGAGKFGSMFLAQARLTTGLQILGIADLDVARAAANCRQVGWTDEQFAAPSLDAAITSGATHIGDDAMALIAHPGLDVVIDATGDPRIGIRHCLEAIRNGKHVIMVNVEADVVAGPLLARKAEQAGVVYSLAWGDQPALITEHVDWARACGFKVVCAGKGTRYLPDYHQLTPDTVWDVLTQYLQIDPGSINLKMFNSFLDGTKSGIEMTAVCNATGLSPQDDGLGFPPASRFELADVCKPAVSGGQLSRDGTTEVVSSLYRDGGAVEHNLAMGTYVVIEGETDYARQCFREYHMLPDSSGQYAALYRPVHMIGLELGISVASAVLRGEPTGSPIAFKSDVVAVAKRDLKKGEVLDGEGGHMVWGKQIAADRSLAMAGLPLGLAGDIPLTRDIPTGELLLWDDAVIDTTDQAVIIRREMEAAFGRANAAE
ncbi:MAG: flagellar biosynthesis protein FlgA [Rhodospirillaceae bacterium]|jgi:predicted homoserine dehydrogenase-like protein|nr:flagellar biosynthesis protein FlgA [Rhodospirillaceae bacterium]MBT4490946.1 flagellar biosynthesis protein FlgA [Rhodospirillaceae bacterium]MBT5193215.1 flagellar biosynthesis protein FlgA [Rhodospirillaceae bacterium]MBT5894654.1 flagellar biosynthesis protein FlgA [Rhodospirillaceae bacterium]MBT6431033.1 flagellar biosynthesis protein FlgA [Rhodospirillaceae bacterium]